MGKSRKNSRNGEIKGELQKWEIMKELLKRGNQERASEMGKSRKSSRNGKIMKEHQKWENYERAPEMGKS